MQEEIRGGNRFASAATKDKCQNNARAGGARQPKSAARPFMSEDRGGSCGRERQNPEHNAAMRRRHRHHGARGEQRKDKPGAKRSATPFEPDRTRRQKAPPGEEGNEPRASRN